jgi:hypothetical protein
VIYLYFDRLAARFRRSDDHPVAVSPLA